ncbi:MULTISPECIES: AMP-binding protein [unclassified Corallococcus]|uniref:AMP-binding protein n=1 Tax=unclassified Corallococcus TaxID=2685029 RepID=UPI001A8FC8F2|nr:MULTISPECIES: AMP-binding protein [unclassified Corallococcus]MBN9684672.1 AMP-binding protein [Corallococcus sp. NCSPR001]WAS83856.1 AMP-binding protein [Corallococcus sp. NCRR]
MDTAENGEDLFHSTIHLADLLYPHAERLGEGSSEEWSASLLDTRARALGTWLRTLNAAGERVLLLYPPGLEYVVGFMGCLYVGAIAVPCHPPDPSRLDSALHQLLAIARDCGARFVLTTSNLLELSPCLTSEAPELGGLHWVATDMVPTSLAEDWKPPARAPEALPPVSMDAPLLDTDERYMRLHESHDPAPLDDSRCIPARFRAQAARTPDAVAVAADDEALTYAQLDAASDALAWHLREHGVARDVRVGLCVERATRMVVAMLGILKAGGAFVPLDPDGSREQLAAMMEDSRARVLVTQSHLVEHLPTDGVRTVVLDSEDAFELDVLGPPRAGSTLDDPAYVLYSSGASGKPSGVVVPHRSVADFFSAMDSRVGAAPEGTWLAVSRAFCDSSVLELLWTLVCGFRVGGAPHRQQPGLSACARATAALP